MSSASALPALPADVDPEAYLNELADEALSGRAEGVSVHQIAPVPDVIDVTRLGLRKDGTSIYRPPGEERFVTSEHLDLEQHLVDVALLPVPQRITPEAAAAALAGTDLDPSQREACAGLLTSTRLINCLVAPAGTGKTHVMAAFARIWAAETGGRVIGLTASTNAARVMAAEAEAAGAPMITRNIAQFLGKIKDSDRTRGHMEVYPGDVLVVDEASQVSTEDMGRIVEVARRCGAMVVGVGDTGQLEAVDAGGIFRLIAARHGHWQAARGPPVPARMGAGGLAQAPPRRGGGAGRVRRPRPDLPRPAGPRLRRRGEAVAQRAPVRPGVPADGHVERDGGPAGRPWPASGWPSSDWSARRRSRWRTATGPGAVTWSGPG